MANLVYKIMDIGGIVLQWKLFASAVIFYAIYKWSTRTDIPKITGLFEIPNARPFFGHLLQLGDDHATAFENLWRTHGHSTFQIRLGNMRAVVVNSLEDNRALLVGHQSALIDRPTLYTFHGVISSTQGFTIGTSPWDESCKRRRTVAGATLARPALRQYHEMFDLESFGLLADTFRDSQQGATELNLHPYHQRLAMNTLLTLCYGVRIDDVYDDMLREIIEVGSAISLLRSASENYQDYVPFLRLFPSSKTERSKSLRNRRDKYLGFLLDKTRTMIEAGTAKTCIASAIIGDTETKLSSTELSSLCLSLVSGGFETIPCTLTSCIGSLSTPEGQRFQERAFEDIKRHYPDDTCAEVWRQAFLEEKVPYINAIVKESLRYYTAQPMSLPRKTLTDVQFGGSTIPAGTMILNNAQAANHETHHWGPDAQDFNPERWLIDASSTPQEVTVRGLQHLSYGAGARACPGQLVANRVLYTNVLRLICSYRFEASKSAPPTTDYIDFNKVKSGLVAVPRDFKVRLIPRDPKALELAIDEARTRTKGYYKE